VKNAESPKSAELSVESPAELPESAEGLKRELMRTRTEISFIVGDRAHGGPSQDRELKAFQLKLRAIEGKLAAILRETF
jgi:hypothetical protein